MDGILLSLTGSIFSEKQIVWLYWLLEAIWDEWDDIYNVSLFIREFPFFFLLCMFYWPAMWKSLFSDFHIPVLLSALLTEKWKIQKIHIIHLLLECLLSHFPTTEDMSDWNLDILSPLSGREYLTSWLLVLYDESNMELFPSVITHPVNTASLCLVFQQVFLQNDPTPSLQSLITCRLCYVCLGLLFVGPALVLSSLRWRKYQT